MPCFKPFIAGLNTGYGAFDTEHVASRVYGSSYGSNGNHNNGNYPRQRRSNNSRIKWGSEKASGKSKSELNFDKGPNSIVGGAEGEGSRLQRRTDVDDRSGIGNATTSIHNHHGQPSQTDKGVGLDPRVNTVQEEERVGGEGKAITHMSSAVAQDGNSMRSDDSRQMIIRKDVTWAVEYSDPSSKGS